MSDTFFGVVTTPDSEYHASTRGKYSASWRSKDHESWDSIYSDRFLNFFFCCNLEGPFDLWWIFQAAIWLSGFWAKISDKVKDKISMGYLCTSPPTIFVLCRRLKSLCSEKLRGSCSETGCVCSMRQARIWHTSRSDRNAIYTSIDEEAAFSVKAEDRSINRYNNSNLFHA